MADPFATDVVQLDDANVLSGTVDPSAGGGVAAPEGSIFLRSNGSAYVKTGAGDTAWTLVQAGAGGGDLVLIGTQAVAGAAVQSITFAGLNGDVDGMYEIEFQLNRDAGSNLDLRPNGLTTNQRTVFTDWNSTSAPTNIGVAALRFATSMQRPNVWGMGRLWAKTGNNRGFEMDCQEMTGTSGTSWSRWWGEGYWADSVTNITSLELFNSSAGGFGVGSQVSLWKRPY
jgi:hypothetical protein